MWNNGIHNLRENHPHYPHWVVGNAVIFQEHTDCARNQKKDAAILFWIRGEERNQNKRKKLPLLQSFYSNYTRKWAKRLHQFPFFSETDPPSGSGPESRRKLTWIRPIGVTDCPPLSHYSCTPRVPISSVVRLATRWDCGRQKQG